MIVVGKTGTRRGARDFQDEVNWYVAFRGMEVPVGGITHTNSWFFPWQTSYAVLHKKPGTAVDLGIVFGSAPPYMRGDSDMANNKRATGPAVKHRALAPSGVSRQVMPDITLTDPLPSSITLQPLDANGNPVGVSPGDTVNGTLTSDSASFAIGAGQDTTHYTGTIPANTPQGSVANLSATLNGTIQGAPANLTASVKVTINVPPNPVAVDLAIIFG